MAAQGRKRLHADRSVWVAVTGGHGAERPSSETGRERGW